MGLTLSIINEALPVPSKAPTVGEHRERVLRGTLGYDDEKIRTLTAAGAFGKE